MRIRDVTILLGSTLTVMAGATISPTLPQIHAAFAIHENADLLVRLILTLPALFIVFFAPIMGYLLDKLGRKPVLLFSVTLYGIAGSSGFYLESLESILISRALLGIAVAGVMSGFTTLIGDYFHGAELAKFMGKQGAFVAFGGVGFLFAGGFLTDVGWQYPFLVYAVALLLLPTIVATIHDKPRCKKQVSAETPTNINWLAISRVYMVGFAIMTLFYIIPVQFAFYVNSFSKTSGAVIGAILATSSLITALTSLEYHRLSRHLNQSQIFILGYLSMGLGFSIIGTSTDIILATAGILLFGLGFGALLPNINVALMSNVTTSTRGKIVGGFTMTFFLGQFFSPILSQPIVNHYSIETSFYTAAVVLGFLAVIEAIGMLRNKS